MAKSYEHISFEERCAIKAFRLQKKSISFIALSLGRSKSSISAELKRNSRNRWYIPKRAEAKARARKKKARRHSKMLNPTIGNFVKSGLEKQWSPEQITGRLCLKYPCNSQIRVSPQGIYDWIARDKEGGGKWYTHLRRNNGRRRKPRYRACSRDARIANRVMIDSRPKSVESKRYLGDWEGDTIQGTRSGGSIATLVERKSRFTLILSMSSNQAGAFNTAVRTRFSLDSWLPKRTLTTDNGTEFSGHEELAKELGIAIYFARPRCSWQRGTNENTNGLIRQYFPKGTNFKTVTEDELAKIEHRLNNRPRKTLGYRTPSEVLAFLLRRRQTVRLVT